MKHLVIRVENLKISKVRGENVHCIISSLIHGIYDFLSKTRVLPEDFMTKVLSVLQTFSVAAFKHHFKHIKTILEITGACLIFMVCPPLSQMSMTS